MSNAARCGRAEEVRRVLEENKDIFVNMRDHLGWSALQWACSEGHDKTVTLLLAHPDINVNQKSRAGYTAFFLACENGKTASVRLLLNDARVTTLNEPAKDGYTPLWCAAENGHLEVIEVWIASGREMDLGQPGNEKNDAVGVAKKRGRPEVVSLLERFRDHPEETRHEVRMEVGWYDEAAEIFALVVFLCDGLLKTKEGGAADAVRFFGVAKELPMDLQVLLCLRLIGSSRITIPAGLVEKAFKRLARQLLSSS